MFKLPNWKQILWIVVFAVISVLLRSGEVIESNWIWWVIAIAFVAVYELLATRSEEQEADSEAVSKENDRFYFYADRCSFQLQKDDILNDVSERAGMKHTLTTKSMALLIVEIRPGMPQFPSSVPTKSVTIAGYPGLAAKVNPVVDEYNQYFINCKDFVVQVSMSIVSEEFLNSFRKEK